MAKENPRTPTKEKDDNSPFWKFERLAKKIARVPKDKVQEKPSKRAS